MTVLPVLRVFAFAMTMSAIAPGILVVAGVFEFDLLAIVFAPGVLVGVTTAWYVQRAAQPSALLRDSTPPR